MSFIPHVRLDNPFPACGAKKKRKAISIISRSLTAAPVHYAVSVGLHRHSATPCLAPGMYNQPPQQRQGLCSDGSPAGPLAWVS